MDEQKNDSPKEDYQMTKKELREAKREEQRAEARRANKVAKTRSISIWVGAFVLLALCVWGLASLSGPSTEQPTLTTTAVAAAEHTKGPSNAPITIIEYSDFQCPACRQYFPVVNQIMENYPNDVRFVYRHYPIRQIHAQAQDAAEAAEAAGMQGKFFEMHDLLFERQTAWEGSNRARTIFEGYATELGLDLEQFKSDAKSAEVKDKIENDYNSGLTSGVTGTPSFFVNGQSIQNPAGFEPFRQMIDAMLAEVAKNTNAQLQDGGNYTIGGDGVVREATDVVDEETASDEVVE